MTEIAKPAERPRWASDVSADVITPSSGKQDTGWVQEYPPLQYFNWLGKYTYEWLNYLERNTDASLGGGALATVTIASGIAIPTTGVTPIDTEAAAATDDLSNLSVVNLSNGRVVVIRSVNAGRVITVKHLAGGSGQINLRLGVDIVLDDPKKAIVLVRNGTQWDELMGFLGSDPAPYLSADLDVRAKKITTTTVNGDVIIEPNGTGSLSPLTAHKAFGKTGTRWGSAFIRDVSVTDWVRTAALDTEASGGTLAIGGTNASIINIGRIGATVAILGSITNVHTTNTFVTDKLITLNDGGLATSGDGAGIEIEEGGSATGYFKVATNRNKWSFKAPNDAAVVSIGAEATVVGDIGLVSSVFTFMAAGYTFKNSTALKNVYISDDGIISVGSATTNSTDPAVNVNRTLTGAGNSHCFSDSSTFSKNSGTAYASYDARITISGNNNLDHYVSFQAAPTLTSFNATITNLYGIYSTANIGSGATITNYSSIRVSDPNNSGTITNHYGIYIEAQASGTNRYAIYSLSTSPISIDSLLSEFGNNNTNGNECIIRWRGRTSGGTAQYAQWEYKNSGLFQLTTGGVTGILSLDVTNNSLTIGSAVSQSHALKGYFLASIDSSGSQWIFKTNTNASTAVTFIEFQRADGGNCGEIVVNTSAQTTAYSTSSDARYKKDIGDFDAISMIMESKPRKYVWIHDRTQSDEIGFFAQELYDIAPWAVVVGDENKKWGIDYGRITAIAFKGIQQHEIRIRKIEAILNIA
jgi:hypothetical protein